jgi:RHS repeat-associated protein
MLFPNKFNTHELDQTGLSYFQARYYDADTGRFITPDPTIPNPEKSQHWNRYMFVSGNPIRFQDISGYEETEGTQQETVNESTGNGNKTDSDGVFHQSDNNSSTSSRSAETQKQIDNFRNSPIGKALDFIGGAIGGGSFGAAVGGAIGAAIGGIPGAALGAAIGGGLAGINGGVGVASGIYGENSGGQFLADSTIGLPTALIGMGVAGATVATGNGKFSSKLSAGTGAYVFTGTKRRGVAFGNCVQIGATEAELKSQSKMSGDAWTVLRHEMTHTQQNRIGSILAYTALEIENAQRKAGATINDYPYSDPNGLEGFAVATQNWSKRKDSLLKGEEYDHLYK